MVKCQGIHKSCLLYALFTDAKSKLHRETDKYALYAEGEYIQNCSLIWLSITYGERNHWNNLMFATFYYTHRFRPMMTITGCRPMHVVGSGTTPAK